MSLKRRVRAGRRWFNRAAEEFLPNGGRDAVRQFLIIYGFYVFYGVARALARGREITAIGNGRAIMNAERALHIYVEPWLQAKVSHVRPLIQFFDFFYLHAHVFVTIACLVWIYVRRNDVFAFFRNWFLAMNGLALICFTLAPTAPPRLLPTSGIVDTLYLFSSSNFQTGIMGGLANPYAAVPSLHIGYALFVTLAIFLLAVKRSTRILAAIYPVLVLLGVIVTGNHFLFDALAGALVAFAAYLFALSVSSVSVTEPLPVVWREMDGY